MRILFVLEHYYPHVGGVELVFQRLAEGFAKSGDQVTVVTTRLPHTKLRENLNGVEIVRVLVPPVVRRYFFTLCSIPYVLSRARKADVIHTTTYNGAFPAWLASKLLHKPCVLTVHEALGHKWGTLEMNRISLWFHRALERILFTFSFTHYIAVSYSTRNQLATFGVPAKKISVIYNGVDEEFRKLPSITPSPSLITRRGVGLSESDFVFLYYGRPGATKGVEILIRSFHHVAAAHPHARLVLMVTKTPRLRYKKIVSLILQSPAEEHIYKLDPVARESIPDIISMSDCVVIPSLTEGFGFTAVEAAASGKPLVVTRAGSLPEVVSGRVVWTEPGSVEHLVRSLLKAVQGEFENIPVKRFSWDDTIEKTRVLYDSLRS